MIEEKQLTKLYYSIGEVADMLQVATSNIRFWEKQFPQLAPKKNNKGNRVFTPKEVLLLQGIYNLLHHEGYTIEGAKKALKSKPSQPASSQNMSANKHLINEVINDLEAIKSNLLDLKSK